MNRHLKLANSNHAACVCMSSDRLAKVVQQGTPSCPEKAKKMGLKYNKLDAPFKQVSSLYRTVNKFEQDGSKLGQCPLILVPSVK